MAITTHEINIQGLSGGIFWSTILAIIFYILGFATVGWETTSNNYWVGLWATCSSSRNWYQDQDWFKATQAMVTIGLILLIGCLLAIFLYMFIHSLSMSKTLLIKAFAIMAFLGVIFMLIGFIIYGAKHQQSLNWSFAFCVIGGIFLLIAAILSIFQMKQSHVV